MNIHQKSKFDCSTCCMIKVNGVKEGSNLNQSEVFGKKIISDTKSVKSWEVEKRWWELTKQMIE